MSDWERRIIKGVQIRAFVWGMWVGAKIIVVIYLLTEGPWV